MSVEISMCNKTLQAEGKPFPRTCMICGLFGPCREGELTKKVTIEILERENAAMREELAQVKKHLREANKGAETNAKISWSMAGHLNDARDEIAAMREAIKGADGALRKCLNYILTLPMSGSDAECEAMDDSHHALSKLQPFLKP